MSTLLESVFEEIGTLWKAHRRPRTKRAFRCRCGRSLFFRNSYCLGCGAELGYEPGAGELLPLESGRDAGTWRLHGNGAAVTYRRCANFESVAGCNWLLRVDETGDHCVACRLNRTIPDLSDPDNQRYWRLIENAKRRLVSQLVALELPVESRLENPTQGLAFDFLRSPPDGPRVMTGHAGGVITINAEEADDAKREQIRHALREPYRSLLGHFRHEIGHYYWDRLIAGTRWHKPFRALFGDEQADYGAALKANYENGPPPDWRERYISSYASTHPWEDWAETWAHFLHILDSLDTAIAHGLDAEDLETEVEPYTKADLYDPDHPTADRALGLLNAWLEMVTFMNEMARSLGQPDFYPFVMSRPVVKKLDFIRLVINDSERLPPPARD